MTASPPADLGSVPRRPLPALTPETRPFFTAGLVGDLVITTCGDCGYLTHPPLPICAACASRVVEPRPVSGRARVEAFTINLYPWHPAFSPPYVIAIVSLAEQEDVHLTTNIVGCDPDAVHIGMEVVVRFTVETNLYGEQVALPEFTPAMEVASV